MDIVPKDWHQIKVFRPGAYADQPGYLIDSDSDRAAARLYESIAPSIFRFNDENNEIGSGFLISNDGKIATDSHISMSGRELTVESADGKTYAAKVINAGNSDTSIVQIINWDHSAQPLVLGSSKDLKPSDRLYALGHFAGSRDVQMSIGNFLKAGVWHRPSPMIYSMVPELKSEAMQQGKVDADLIVATNPIKGGGSGGPVFTDDGKVVGLNETIFGGITPVERLKELQQQEQNYEITYQNRPAKWVRQLLGEKDDSKFWMSPTTKGIALAAVAGLAKALPKRLGPISAALLGAESLENIESFRSSTSTAQGVNSGLIALEYGVAAVGSLALLAGKTRGWGAGALAASAIARVATDLLPTHLVATQFKKVDNRCRQYKEGTLALEHTQAEQNCL